MTVECIHYAEATLKYYAELVADSHLAIRIVLLVPQEDNKSNKDLLSLTIGSWAKFLFKISRRDTTTLLYNSYQEETPTLVKNKTDLHFFILQNKRAELVYPIEVDSLTSQLTTWAQENHLSECDLSHLAAFSGVSWRLTQKF